jgi:hypothetical protein
LIPIQINFILKRVIATSVSDLDADPHWTRIPDPGKAKIKKKTQPKNR